MKEEKILKELFEQAREETPALSFEQAATRFTDSLSVSPLEYLRTRLFGKNALYTILTLIFTGTALFLFFDEESTSQEAAVLIEVEAEVKEESQETTDQSEQLTAIVQPEVISAEPEKMLVTGEDSSADTLAEESKLELPKAPSMMEKLVDTTIRNKDLPPIIEPEFSDTASAIQEDSITIPEEKRTATGDESRKLIVGAEHSNDKLSIKEEEVANTVNLIIERSDKLEDCDKFIEAINQLGLGTKNSYFREVDGTLHKMNLQLSHPKGLAFKMKSRGFEKFELQVHFDGSNQIIGISYSFNDRAFSRIHSITSKGRVQYSYKIN